MVRGKSDWALSQVLRAPEGMCLAARYQVKRQLGKQSGRIALLARDLETQQPVVVKLLFFDSEMSWDDLKLFEREIETLKSLSHPAIPQYLDSFELEFSDCKGIALVQSYIEAQSLESAIAEGGKLSEGEIRSLVKSLLEILAYLHQRRPPVIHRDIKPSNILWGDRADSVYLVDFGSVQTLAKQEGQTVTVVGTYGYMPPEQFGGRATPATDLYGLGATAIALACGIHPADLPHKGMHLDFERQVDLSPPFVRWLQQKVEPALERRFSSAEQALEALERPPIEKTSVATLELFWHCFWRSTAMGCLAGGTYGSIYGTMIFPLFGTIYGGGVGGSVGFFVGVANGIYLGLLTRLCFFPLERPQLYLRIASFSSILLGTVLSIWGFNWYLGAVFGSVYGFAERAWNSSVWILIPGLILG
ncbi:MAG: serine/threonine-protein kinase, partial [Cyanobacteriota bacterium]|nr:serine/threonine-protein kinase [Cyanobacteriota bacterium]